MAFKQPELGQIIKDRREELNISPQLLADKLGVTMDVYFKYENGGLEISMFHTSILCDCLGLNLLNPKIKEELIICPLCDGDGKLWKD